MKKYLGLKKISGKVVAAMLAASMLIGNVGAMKPACAPQPRRTSGTDYCAKMDCSKAWDEANKLCFESDILKRQIVSTVYTLMTMDQLCTRAKECGIDPIIIKKAFEQVENAVRNDPYYRYVKSFSEEHPGIFIAMMKM